jgi:hypothetical protein
VIAPTSLQIIKGGKKETNFIPGKRKESKVKKKKKIEHAPYYY